MAATAAAVENAAAEEWLTLDEVAERLRFLNRRALLAYLRRNPAPVFQRVGSQRYFMRSADIDRIMAPIDLPAVSRRRLAKSAEDDPASFVQISGPPAEAADRASAAAATSAAGKAPGRRAPRPRSGKPAGNRSRRMAPKAAR